MEDPERNALLQGAQIKLRKEDCAGGMVESIDVAVKDATIMPSKEECASGMGQKSSDAAAKDAHMMLNREVCA